ncbi:MULTISPECIES: 3-hydroxyacyl-CoA dehydrogenase [unclassified Chelatococcus]|uniref:3-hydroxyacyl-CoA dehydrogenase n=1 Tax=unclassified Chelatococcus TaxID=2638111 RepID=UPI001BCBDE78|nr:3-hydroxyacyl-CoA dehydrogenase [Chelatococcus sp.]MBS7700230.1 3-hydroxyacyl-CoA dehydrogenase [Chelatococcus sp. YT9]MBX3558201.1 3-hydroxyacyl-CoA dehydrogenase [Chelatococcus sp.]
MPSNDKITVVGAGQMGLGVAHAFVSAGYTTTLVDISEDQLKRAREAILRIVEEGISRGKVTPAVRATVEAGLRCTTDLTSACMNSDLVVETATEDIKIKIDILQSVSANVGDNTVIATNTSALSITELAASVGRPERVIGMHFFNPVHKMKLCEIIRGLQSSDETVARTRHWAGRVGKTHILVNEAPGFTTSRISAMLGNEAMWMLSEGVASAEDIDTSLRMAFNHPMGPLELGDLTGWDTRLSVLKYLHQTLGEKFRPCPLITKMVQAGRYGRKVGHGVYKYEQGEKVAGSGLRPY